MTVAKDNLTLKHNEQNALDFENSKEDIKEIAKK